MGKLADFLAMKRDLAFDYERELKAVRNAILCVTRISGSEYTLDLRASESFVASSPARKAFEDAFSPAAKQVLLAYAGDLARESLAYGLGPEVVAGALDGCRTHAPKDVLAIGSESR